MNDFYRRIMEYLLSISPANEHAIDVAIAYLEGNHGYHQDLERGKRMLEITNSDSARFYLGYPIFVAMIFRVIHQHNHDDNLQVAKMNLDAASTSF